MNSRIPNNSFLNSSINPNTSATEAGLGKDLPIKLYLVNSKSDDFESTVRTGAFELKLRYKSITFYPTLHDKENLKLLNDDEKINQFYKALQEQTVLPAQVNNQSNLNSSVLHHPNSNLNETSLNNKEINNNNQKLPTSDSLFLFQDFEDFQIIIKTLTSAGCYIVGYPAFHKLVERKDLKELIAISRKCHPRYNFTLKGYSFIISNHNLAKQAPAIQAQWSQDYCNMVNRIRWMGGLLRDQTC